MSPGTVATPNAAFKVFASDRNTKATYNFYIKISLAGGMVHWAEVGGNEVF